jgi:hypothetical protein
MILPNISSLSDKAKSVLDKVLDKAKSGHFMSFTYTDSKGNTSKKIYRFGGNIGAKLERDRQASVAEFIAKNPGVPYTVRTDSKGNWVTQAKKMGIREGILEYTGKVYVRGTDVKSRNHRTLCLSNMTID